MPLNEPPKNCTDRRSGILMSASPAKAGVANAANAVARTPACFQGWFFSISGLGVECCVRRGRWQTPRGEASHFSGVGGEPIDLFAGLDHRCGLRATHAAAGNYQSHEG